MLPQHVDPQRLGPSQKQLQNAFPFRAGADLRFFGLGEANRDKFHQSSPAGPCDSQGRIAGTGQRPCSVGNMAQRLDSRAMGQDIQRNPIGCLHHQCPVLNLGLESTNRLLSLTAGGDIAGDRDRPRDCPGTVPQRRDRQQNRQQGAVFGHAHGLPGLHTLAAFDPGQNECGFAEPVRGQQPRDRLPLHLRAGIAVDLFRAAAPLNYDVLQIFAENRVSRAFEKCIQVC